MRKALETIAAVCGSMYEFGGVNLGRVAKAALNGSEAKQRAALEDIEQACEGGISINGTNIGQLAKTALEAA